EQHPRYVRNQIIWLCPSYADRHPLDTNGWNSNYRWLERAPNWDHDINSATYGFDSTLSAYVGRLSYNYLPYLYAYNTGNNGIIANKPTLRLGQKVTIQVRTPTNVTPVSILNIASRSFNEVMLMTDSMGSPPNGMSYSTFAQTQHWRTGKNMGGNLLRGDGHVEWLSWESNQWWHIGNGCY